MNALINHHWHLTSINMLLMKDSKCPEAFFFAKISPGYLQLLLTTYQGLPSNHWFRSSKMTQTWGNLWGDLGSHLDSPFGFWKKKLQGREGAKMANWKHLILEISLKFTKFTPSPWLHQLPDSVIYIKNTGRSRRETRNLAPVCVSKSRIFLPPCQDQEATMTH